MKPPPETAEAPRAEGAPPKAASRLNGAAGLILPADVQAEADALAEKLAVLPEELRVRGIDQVKLLATIRAPIDQVSGNAWKEEDISAGLAGDLPKRKLIVPHLIYDEPVLTSYMGHPDEGKSTVAMANALYAAQHGRHTIWLDFEIGRDETIERLKAIGFTPSLRQYIHLFCYPELPASPEGFEPLAEVIGRFTNPLVVVDSLSMALSEAGIEENDNAGVKDWYRELMFPTKEIGGRPLVIDHVHKSATKATPYARGAGGKKGATDVMFYFEKTEEFSIDQIGEIKAWRSRDRLGTLPKMVKFEVGDGHGRLPVTVTEVCKTIGGEGAQRDKRLRAIDEGIFTALMQHEKFGLTTSQVVESVRGKGKDVRDELKRLGADPVSPVERVPADTGNGIRWMYDAEAVRERADRADTALSIGDGEGA